MGHHCPTAAGSGEEYVALTASQPLSLLAL